MTQEPTDDGVDPARPAARRIQLADPAPHADGGRRLRLGRRYEGYLMEIGARVLLHLDPACERFWVAEKDGEVVGCVGIVREDETTARLRTMYVEPTARGLGLGRRLVDECMRFCREKGYSAIVLWTLGVLEAARGLYAPQASAWSRPSPGTASARWSRTRPGGWSCAPGGGAAVADRPTPATTNSVMAGRPGHDEFGGLPDARSGTPPPWPPARGPRRRGCRRRAAAGPWSSPGPRPWIAIAPGAEDHRRGEQRAARRRR